MPINPYPVERENRNRAESNPRLATLRSVEAKQQIVNQVIDGRLPLFEAAAKFQAVSGLSSDRELACRTLIGWVVLALSDRPEQADRVSDRLERELQNYLESSEQVHRLPTN